MARIRALQPAHKSTKVTVTEATRAFKKLQNPKVRTQGADGGSGTSPAPAGKTQRRPSRRGSTPLNVTEYHIINLSQLEALDVDGPVTPETLKEHGLIGQAERPVRVLGAGGLTRKVDVAAHKFSQAARDKILAAGGVVHEL